MVLHKHSETERKHLVSCLLYCWLEKFLYELRIQFKCWRSVEIFPDECFEIDLHKTETVSLNQLTKIQPFQVMKVQVDIAQFHHHKSSCL